MPSISSAAFAQGTGTELQGPCQFGDRVTESTAGSYFSITYGNVHDLGAISMTQAVSVFDLDFMRIATAD
jgi:hypothetical protein